MGCWGRYGWVLCLLAGLLPARVAWADVEPVGEASVEEAVAAESVEEPNTLHVEQQTNNADRDEDQPEWAEEELPELWFPVGEQLEYRVYWGRIPVGTTVITTEWIEEGGRKLLAIRIRTQSNRVLDKIYPVDDIVESVIDPHTFLSVRFTKNLSEGRYRAHQITEFDYDNLIAHWRCLRRDRENTFELEEDTRDLVAFSYYLRKDGFKRGERLEYRVMADDKMYDLWLDVRGNDRIRLRHYGRVRSTEIEPEAAFDGLFVRTGRIQLWVSADDRRVVTEMRASIPVASIRLVLHRVRGPGNDSWILDVEDDDDDEEG